MEKNILQKLIDKGISQRAIANELGVCQATIKHWLKKYGLRTCNRRLFKADKPNETDTKCCTKCGLEKNIIKDFYRQYKNSEARHTVCKQCSNQATLRKMVDTKVKMIIYKGGSCQHCGVELLKTHYSIFEFHHVNPNEKDRDMNDMRSMKWESIVNEINKCILLCSNCHRLEHVKMRNTA